MIQAAVMAVLIVAAAFAFRWLRDHGPHDGNQSSPFWRSDQSDPGD